MPACLVAGDALEFCVTATNYEGEMKAFFAGPESFEITGTLADGMWAFSEDQTSNLTAGEYRYQIVLTDAPRRTVATGRITISASLENAEAFDARSDAVQALEKVNAAINGSVARGVQEYTIAGRSLKRYGINELLRLRDSLRREVEQEKLAERLANGRSNTVRVRL